MLTHTRGRKIYRDIMSRKVRTLLVCTSIFIGVLGVITLISMGDILLGQLEATVKEENLAMVQSYLSKKSDEPLASHEYLNTFEELPDISSFQALAITKFAWRLPVGDELDEGYMFAYSKPFDALPIEPISLIDGRYPTAGNQEIAVERRFASKYELSIGDQIVLRVMGKEGVDTATTYEESWTVVGMVYQPHQYPVLPGAPIFVRGEESIYVNHQDAEYIGGFSGFTLLEARYPDHASALRNQSAFESNIVDETPYAPIVTLVQEPSENAFMVQMRAFKDVLAVLGIVSLLVSGFLVFNVVNTMILEQKRQIGVMKSIGADTRDNVGMYSGMSLIYGVIGVVPGVLLGIPAGFGAAQGLAAQWDVFIDTFTISTTAVVLGILLGLLVPVLASVYPVMKGIRVSIMEALTDLGIDATYTRGPLARLTDSLPLPISMKQAFRDVIQKKGRLALTMVTLSLAAGAFMGVYSVFSSFGTVIDDIFNTLGNDITINPNQAYELEDIRELVLNNVAGVESVNAGTNVAIDIEGFTPRQIGGAAPILFAFGLDYHDPKSASFNLTSGTAWNDDPDREGVVISKGIADIMGKTTGDTLKIRAGSNAQEFEILGTVSYFLDVVWFKWDTLARLGGVVSGAPVPNQYQTTVTIGDDAYGIVGINDFGGSALEFTDGEFTNDGVIVTEALAENKDYSVGDTLTLVSGENGGDYEITGIFNLPAALRQPDQPDEGLAMNWQSLAELEGISLDGEPRANAFPVILENPTPTVDEVQDLIDDIDTILEANGISANYTNWVQNAEFTSQALDASGAVMNFAALMIATVGAIGLLSVLSMSVFERQKEIGVMRSIGATSTVIATQFLAEGLIVGIIAWIVGVPLSLALNKILVAAFNASDASGLEFPLETLPIGLFGMLMIATVASLWPSISAARKTVSDILRYQ